MICTQGLSGHDPRVPNRAVPYPHVCQHPPGCSRPRGTVACSLWGGFGEDGGAVVAAPQLSSMHEVAAAIQRWIQPRCKAAAYGPCSPVGPKTRLAAAFPLPPGLCTALEETKLRPNESQPGSSGLCSNLSE